MSERLEEKRAATARVVGVLRAQILSREEQIKEYEAALTRAESAASLDNGGEGE